MRDELGMVLGIQELRAQSVVRLCGHDGCFLDSFPKADHFGLKSSLSHPRADHIVNGVAAFELEG